MIGRALRYLFGGVPAQFDSALPDNHALAQLQAATLHGGAGRQRGTAASGEVAADHVSLQASRPGDRNAFAPVFTGAFRADNGHTRLQGTFAPHFLVRAFMALWLLIASGWTLGATYLVLRQAPQWRWFPLVGLALLGIVLGIVNLARTMAQRDIEWLSALIQRALAAPHGQPQGGP